MEYSFDIPPPSEDNQEDRDTIELDLNPYQVKSVSQAPSVGSDSAVPIVEGSEPGLPPRTESSTRHLTSPRFLTIAAASIALFGSFAYLTAEPERPPPATPAVVSFSEAEPLPTVAEASAAVAPVKFANPFDRREIFEFPAGTTRTAARDAVAEILMQRARDRGVPALDKGRRNRAGATQNEMVARQSKPNSAGGH